MRVTLCVFAKPARPGMAKTRLIPAVGAEAAAALAFAFLEDTWDAVRSLGWADPVLAVTEEDAPLVALAGAAPVWLQGEGDLGARLERVLRRALDTGRPAIAVGADSPGLPPRLLEKVRVALDHHDAVLAPADDGGFYAIGLRRCPPGALAALPWSAAETFQATAHQLRSLGLALAVTEPWFDVDRQEDLSRLADLLAAGTISAPATRRALAQIDAGRRKPGQAPRRFACE